jgi:hypothetical protein
MNYRSWQWNGRIDLFGVDEKSRAELFERWAEEAADGGGEIELCKSSSDLYHTDRFELRVSWSSLLRPFPDLMCELAELIPEGHPSMEVEGLLPASGERLGVEIRANQVKLIPYSMVRGAAIVYQPPAGTHTSSEEAVSRQPADEKMDFAGSAAVVAGNLA